MVLGEDEGEQGRRKMAALLELLAARAGPPSLKKKRLLSQMYFVIIVFERKKFCLFIHKYVLKGQKDQGTEGAHRSMRLAAC